ncbi:MAG: Gfo/Idh/MocA family oxidoreductase [Clostridia bacterium]|nr:Gfo/Idh/MocA family oxidoreductase [Clostridia bacterium]
MRIALVGAGVIARVHMRALLSLGMPPAAVCDIDKGKAHALLAEFSLSLPVFTDYTEMLTDFAPDAVHICTPHHCHADMIVAALARDVHVLSEKPLCISEADIPRILAAEAASRATLGVCHQNRYNPSTLFFKNYLADKTVLTAHGSVPWHRDAAYYASGAWRGRWETEGGGVMINQALHTLDLCQWLFGYPEGVTATVANLSLADAIEVEDTAAATFRGPVPFTFFATNAAGKSLPVSITARTQDEELVLLPHSVTVNGKTAFHEAQNIVSGKACYGMGHATLFADFYGAIAAGRPFPINGREAARVIRMILAMYQSEARAVALAPIL